MKDCERCKNRLMQMLNNSGDRCPRCGQQLCVVWREDFVHDSILVRHACKSCSLMFHPDGTTSPFIFSDEAAAQLELWSAERNAELQSVISQAEEILRSENNDA